VIGRYTNIVRRRTKGLWGEAGDVLVLIVAEITAYLASGYNVLKILIALLYSQRFSTLYSSEYDVQGPAGAGCRHVHTSP